jgi:hypothetical protein
VNSGYGKVVVWKRCSSLFSHIIAYSFLLYVLFLDDLS